MFLFYFYFIRVDIAESFKDFNSLQRPIRSRAGKMSKTPASEYQSTLPAVGATQNSPMTFEIAKKHLWSASAPPPVVPTFLSKQEMQQALQNRTGSSHVQPAHMLILRPEVGKGPIPPKINNRIRSKLFQWRTSTRTDWHPRVTTG